MTRILLIVSVLLLVLVLGMAAAGCRKSGSKGGGYLPAPGATVAAAGA